MPDDNTAAASQVDAAASTPAQAATTTPTTPQAGKSPDDYERMIAELRKENASHRTKLKAHEDAEAARQLAALSDAEKLQKQYEQSQAQIKKVQQENVTLQIQLQATAKGIVNAELISPYVHSKLEFDDNGTPTNLDKVLDEVIKGNPNLVVNTPEPGTPAAQTANRAPAVPAMNPGRSSIQQPGQSTPGRIPRITDPDLWKR